jgi:hypothetical protein
VRTMLLALTLRVSKSALPEEAVTSYLWTGSATDVHSGVEESRTKARNEEKQHDTLQRVPNLRTDQSA